MRHSTFISEKEFLSAYEAHADALFRHCYFRVFNREQGKALMCESFKRLWLFIADGNYVDSMQMFLYRAVDALIAEEEGKIVAEEVPAETSAERAIVSVLKLLPEAQRRMVILHYIDGFSPEEISEVIGGSPQTHAKALEEQRKTLAPILSPLMSHA